MAGRTKSTSPRVPPLSRRDRKKAATRDRIFRTAVRLFREKGYDDVTVERITVKADVGKGTFFNYFPSKMHVLVAFWAETAEEWITYGESVRIRSTRSFIKVLYRDLDARVRTDQKVFAILIREVMVQPELRRLNERLAAKLLPLYLRALEAGVKTGEVRQSVEFPAVLEAIEDLWIGTLRSWVFSGYAFRLRTSFEKKLDLLFDGLCP